MIWHLIAVFIMAVCGGGLAFALIKLSRNRLPKWLIPGFAAAGMLGYLAYYDYGWYDFKRGQLPESAVVLREQRNATFFKPWSYVYPAVSNFVVFDGKFFAREQDHQRLVEYLEYRFRQNPIEGLDTQAFVLNCDTLERVPFDQKHKVSGAVEKIDRDDAVFRKACR